MSLFDELYDHRCTVKDCGTCQMLQRPGETHEQWIGRVRELFAATGRERKNGHPVTPENGYVYPSTGFRACRVCRANSVKRHRLKAAV